MFIVEKQRNKIQRLIEWKTEVYGSKRGAKGKQFSIFCITPNEQCVNVIDSDLLGANSY